MELASETPHAGGLILISPFTSIADVGDETWVYRVLFRPVRWLGHANDFDNRAKIGTVQMPVLIMTGAQDELATPTMAKILYETAKKPKALQLIDGADHNTIALVGAAPVAQAIKTFIAFTSAGARASTSATPVASTSDAPSPAVLKLFEKLQIPETTDQAFDKLESLAESDPKIRNFLVERIPALVDVGPQHYQPKIPESAVQYPGPVWRNAVKLASDLNITEAAPALVKWIGVSNGGMGDLYTWAALTDQPAGQALIGMGDASVPALSEGLTSNDHHHRWDCANALRRIGSPQAMAALRSYATHGTDKELVESINRDSTPAAR
jgi:hypothetical protein